MSELSNPQGCELLCIPLRIVGLFLFLGRSRCCLATSGYTVMAVTRHNADIAETATGSDDLRKVQSCIPHLLVYQLTGKLYRTPTLGSRFPYFLASYRLGFTADGCRLGFQPTSVRHRYHLHSMYSVSGSVTNLSLP